MKFDSNFLHHELQRFFGFNKFKGNQEKIISSVLEGEDAFVIMPTGAGKSLCYQLPALIMPGTAIIVSPLIALMKNQVDAIRNFGEEDRVAHYLNSSLTKAEIKGVKEDLIEGRTKLLYVAPESLTKEDNIAFLKKLDISLYAIDEAHCISEWGHDFRPEYRNIQPIIKAIGKKAPVLALTATATPKVQKDIQKNLGMGEAKVYCSSFNRDNLYYEVRRKTKSVDNDIVRFIKKHSGKSGIVYCLSRRRVEDFAEKLQINGIKALPYHAGLDAQTRASNQDSFIMENTDVIVATIAFGMGIDKPDVRFVIHYDMPKSLEGYYQETGRAGRDGGEGICIAYYCEEDISKLEKFVKDKKLVSEQEVARQLIAETISYAETSMCRRKNLLHYFGEVYEQENCASCDNCVHPKERQDATEDVGLVLESILAVNQQFKDKHIAAILMGKISPDVRKYKHNELSLFGQGEERDEMYWNAVVRQCLMEDLLYKDVENYGILKLTKQGHNFLKKSYTVMVAKDHNYESEEEDFADFGGARGGGEAVDKVLYSMLKEQLKYTARKEGLPPYVIFQEASLEDMTVQYPITMEEMSHITGVGVNKANRYGQVFIDLIKRYVEENEIERPRDFIIKSVANKSGLKVYIIQNVDRKISLEDIAIAKNVSYDEVLAEVERIVSSGTKLNLDYYVDDVVDPYHLEEIYNYFLDSDSDSIKDALCELGENEYTEDEVRLVRLKFLSKEGH